MKGEGLTTEKIYIYIETNRLGGIFSFWMNLGVLLLSLILSLLSRLAVVFQIKCVGNIGNGTKILLVDVRYLALVQINIKVFCSY